jgi:DNA polymerase-1
MISSKGDVPKKLLIDADFLIYSVGFASEEASEKFAKSRLVETMEDMVYLHLKADTYEAFLTGKDNYRYGIAKTVPYKGNRKDMKKPIHYEALREHMVKRLGAVVVDGQEADDEVAIRMTKEPDQYLLVGVDKDLRQIPGWHHNPHKAVTDYVSDFEGFKAFVTQVLTGDRVDNIPGLSGIGPAKAAKALKDAKTKEALLRKAFEVYMEKGHSIEYFIEQGQLLWLRRYEGEMWQPDVNLLLNKQD